MSKAFRIRDWDALYETHDSRKLKSCKFVYVPNKHDGAGYRRMTSHKHAERLFAAWVTILQVASKMKVRGLLVDHDKPVTALDMHYKTGFKVETFEMAFTFFCTSEIGWIEEIDIETTISRSPPEYPEAPRSFPAVGALKGTEGKGIEQNNSLPYPPTVERVKRCVELYPKTRPNGTGGRESVSLTQKAKEALQSAIDKDPAYPWEFACEWVGKHLQKPRDLRNFVDDPPAVESMREDMRKHVIGVAERLRAISFTAGEEAPRDLGFYAPMFDYVTKSLFEMMKTTAVPA